MTKTKVVLLGTGSPALIPGRYQSATAIIVDDQPYIIDCGSGCLERITEAKAKGLEALSFEKLNRLFLTHFHPDHTVGLPGFIIGPWIRGRKELQILGPLGTGHLVEGILKSYQKGINEHLHHGPTQLDPLDIPVTEYSEGVIYQDQFLTAEAFRVDHGNLDAYGFKFTTPDKIIVISGDTCPVPKLSEAAANCDILVHEVYSETEMRKFPRRFREYFQKVHTGGYQLGKIAHEANPGLLVLTHQMRYGQSVEELMAEVRTHFQGNLAFGNDLDVFE